MASVIAHYDNHLGPIYGWMLGNFDAATAAARDELRDAGIGDGAGRVAIDLGSGPGAHAIALAEAGYHVTAIDACAPLVHELRQRASGLAIRCVLDDLMRVNMYCSTQVDVITCMGDTLTHLPSVSAVERLFETIADSLTPRGVFVMTFRDYCGVRLSGIDRFIPVRQDDHRILTCMLEYHDETMSVYDVVHERTASGWSMRVSHYPKLRLEPAWVLSACERLGFRATIDVARDGMVRITASHHAGIRSTEEADAPV